MGGQVKFVNLADITENLDNKRVPLNSAQRLEKSKQRLYPYIGANNILEYIDEYIFDEKILCVAEDGGSWGDNEVCAKIYNEKCWVNNHAHVLKSKGNVILEYLAGYLNYANLNSYITGTTRGKLTKSKLDSIKIPLPPLDDQIRIAHLLGKVEGLIAQRKQHLQQLDGLLKSVFLEMFGDPVRNEKGWETAPFNKIGKFISGGTPSKSRDDFWSGDFPWVSPKDMKISKIEDAIDHISEKVFEETSLKRITSGHLLIVVRGMILAHSFPVAINMVEIAINQDMKAIKPAKGMNVVYLQNCLISLTRQILKLISTAGHGTRKFDAVAMQKLFIPKPPGDLQNQFAAIVEKVEGLKSRYQQSLTDLEHLYGALSQTAFKGGLDLSRIPLHQEMESLGKYKKIAGQSEESIREKCHAAV